MDAQVVHVDLEPLFRDHVCKDMIHKCLEGQWSIAETKEHDCGFIEAKWSNERSLPLILFANVNVVITPSYIKFGEEGGILHVID